MSRQSEYVSLNRWVLSLDVNIVMKSDRLMFEGREFYSLGEVGQDVAPKKPGIPHLVGLLSIYVVGGVLNRI